MAGNFHYPRSQMAVQKHCKKCRVTTFHRINGDRTAGDCLECLYAIDPRILSGDELTVLGISENQLKLDIWAKQSRKEVVAAPAARQGGLFS